MSKIWKQALSLVLAMVMICGSVPMQVFATDTESGGEQVEAETAITAQVSAAVEVPADITVGGTVTGKGTTEEPAGTIPVGTHWAGPVKSDACTCGKDEHTHGDACYTTPDVTACAHHLESTLLGHPDTCAVADMNDPCTKRICFSSHKTVDGTKYHVTFQCQHTHTKSCYTLGCSFALKGEHTHSEPACYSYTWTLAWNEYDITWNWVNADGTPASQTDKVNHGTVLKAPSVPTTYTQDGATYTFIGWDGLVLDAIAEGPAAFNASYTKKTVYTVTFESNGGSSVAQQTIEVLNDEAQDVVAEPAVPTRENSVFAGWYADEALTEAYVFGSKPTENIILYAKWESDMNNNGNPDDAETISVKIDGNGTVEVAGEGVAALPVSAENVTGYVFDGTKETVEITITAIPVVTDGISSTYVQRIAGAELTYGENFAATAQIKASSGLQIEVVFAEAGFTYDDDGELSFLPGMETAVKKDVYEAVISAPEYSDETVDVKYLAREKGSYPVYIPVLVENVPIVGSIGGQYIDIPLEERWVDVDATFAEVDVNALVNEKIEGVKALIEAGKYLEAVSQISNLATELAPALQDYNCHIFGAKGSEQLRVSWEDNRMKLYGEPVVSIVDDRKTAKIAATEATVYYGDFDEAALMTAINAHVTDEAGNPIATSAAVTYDGFLPVKNVGEYPITVKFAGDLEYRPAEAVVTLTVAKAPSNTDVANQIISYGETVAGPVFTNKDGQAVDINAFRFVVGLDASDMDVNGDGVRGLSGKIQLMLPEEYQSILDLIGLGNGKEYTLNELFETLQNNSAMLEGWGLSAEAVNTLRSALNAVGNIAESGELKVVIGGAYPTNIGVYLMGAVTADANYETSFDAGYLVIKPDATQVELEWNYIDENGVFTQQKLQSVDLGAHASDAAANDQILTLFFGVGENGEMILTWDQKDLTNGVYTELAFLDSYGNTMYYAVPIVRTFAVLPGLVNAQIVVDGKKADNNMVVFDNAPVDVQLNVTYNGLEMGEGWTVEESLSYYGVQTNTEIYESTTAPVHAGTYVVTAQVIVRDENAELVAMGADLATIVIKPAQTKTVADDVTLTVGDDFDLMDDMIHVTTNSGVAKPDVTIISAKTGADVTTAEKAWSAIEGHVNVDFPKWMDEILEKHVPGVKDGITAAEFVKLINGKLPAVLDKLEEAGATGEILSAFGKMVEKVCDSLANVPENVSMTFQDVNDDAFRGVGTYVVAAVVTDSDHMPTADWGILNVKPIALEITVQNASKVYGEEDAAFTYEITAGELIAGDQLDVTFAREEGENVGEYAITATVAENENYEIDVKSGVLTIKAKAITDADVKLAEGTLVYDGTEQTQEIVVTEGVTYEVSGNTATDAGEYELTVTGTGNYTGEVKLTWKIEEAAKPEEPATIHMYRLYNRYTNEHLLVSDETEMNSLLNVGWLLDGIAWDAPADSGAPVYRLYNPYDDWHTYTSSEEELVSMVQLGWKVDGVMCYSADEENGKPVYRLFNPYEQKNYHLLTASWGEVEMLLALGWRMDGVAWYAVK